MYKEYINKYRSISVQVDLHKTRACQTTEQTDRGCRH